MPVADLLRLIVETIPLYVLRLDLLLVVGVVLFMVYSQYQRVAYAEWRLFGFVSTPVGTQLVRSLLYGFLGGVVATLLFVLLGIALNDVGIWYLWLLAVVLMFFHPRFLCFSYGGGLLALSHLLFGVPKIEVGALMALVAVLHLVEAFLIWVSGAEGAAPVYAREPGGQVVGGYTLQKFWPLPFIGLVGMAVPPGFAEAAGAIDMPGWWPIIEPVLGEPGAQEYAFALFPVVAALGYSDVALTRLPEAKARRTSLQLMAYSVALLALAILSQQGKVFALAAALFAPLAHEWVIRAARRTEVEGPPTFSGAETMVLAVKPGSPAEKAGIRPGDVIEAVNGVRVATREDLAEAMEPWALDAQIEVRNALTGERRALVCPGKIPPLGLLLVPRGDERIYVELGNQGRFGPRWLGRPWRR